MSTGNLTDYIQLQKKKKNENIQIKYKKWEKKKTEELCRNCSVAEGEQTTANYFDTIKIKKNNNNNNK